jgi:hypothetical protein
MKLVPQGGVITLIRGVSDKMGEGARSGEIPLPRAQSRGKMREMEIKEDHLRGSIS